MGVFTDEELARRAQTGDEQAAEELFSRHGPRLRAQARRTLRGILRRRVGCSDVVQEAYISAFRSLEDFEDRGPGSFARWLEQILRHKAADEARRHVGAAKRGGAREISQGDRSAPERPSDQATPSVAASEVQQLERMRVAMASLPESYRNVLDAVHRGRMTLEAVGEATGRSANATCKLYGRAVQALAKAMRTSRDA